MPKRSVSEELILTIDPLAAFAMTLSTSIVGVAYVLRMATLEARKKCSAKGQRS
jgi:hypothetical protein